MPPLQVLHVVQEMLVEFTTATQSLVEEQGRSGMIRVKWHKPPLVKMKIIWDAALNKETKNMGVGVVIRDADGAFVAALSKLVPYISDPLTAETVAVWHAAQLGCEFRDSKGTTRR
jgi:hypothetical protein